MKPRDRLYPSIGWKGWLRLSLFVGVVWLVTAQVDFAEIHLAFARLKVPYLLPVVFVLTPLAVILRALRWRRLLPEGHCIPLIWFVRAYVMGVLANSLLLGKWGELVRARLICTVNVKYSRSLAVVIVDRLIEGVSLLLVFGLVLLSSSLPDWAYQLAGVAAAAAVGGIVVLRLLSHFQRQILRVSEVFLRRLPERFGERLRKEAETLLLGFETLSDFRRIFGALLYGLIVWTVEIAAVMLFLAAMSIPAPWLVAAVVTLVVLNFGTLLPISPGSVGVYQLLCLFVLSIWAVDSELAFAFGIVMQTVLFVPLYLVGSGWLLLWTKSRTPAILSPTSKA